MTSAALTEVPETLCRDDVPIVPKLGGGKVRIEIQICQTLRGVPQGVSGP